MIAGGLTYPSHSGKSFYAAAGADTNWTQAQVDAIVALIDAKLAPKAPAKRTRKAKVATGQDILDMAVEAAELEAEDDATTPAEVDAAVELPEVAPVVGKNGRPATKKQLLGAMIHAAGREALMGELPEGLSATEADEIVTKWLQYIPTPATPGGWQPKA